MECFIRRPITFSLYEKHLGASDVYKVNACYKLTFQSFSSGIMPEVLDKPFTVRKTSNMSGCPTTFLFTV